MGSRLFGYNKVHPGIIRACGRHCDVVTFNIYGNWAPSHGLLDAVHRWSDKPIMITEWYAKGMDTGLLNTSGAGFRVHTQEDRARFYQHHQLGAFQHPAVIGSNWFRYMDHLVEHPKNQSNKGIVNHRFEPYTELTSAMTRFNRRVYRVTDFLKDSPLDFSFNTNRLYDSNRGVEAEELHRALQRNEL